MKDNKWFIVKTITYARGSNLGLVDLKKLFLDTKKITEPYYKHGDVYRTYESEIYATNKNNVMVCWRFRSLEEKNLFIEGIHDNYFYHTRVMGFGYPSGYAVECRRE
jgi:hypothetical protein